MTASSNEPKEIKGSDSLVLDILKRIDGMQAGEVIEALEAVSRVVRQALLLAPVSMELALEQDSHLCWLAGKKFDPNFSVRKTDLAACRATPDQP